jgi:CDP-6-deoxy-D-xylo-4-hexulose-3-dehydrase
MKWPLNTSHFTFLDRLKICLFFLNPKKIWTMGAEVESLEDTMAKYTGARYAIFTSSGSAANTLIAMSLKDFGSPQPWSHYKREIIFPSTTWATSVTPFIREGFVPKFIDVSPHNLSLDLHLLEQYLLEHSQKVRCVFLTSLLGFTPHMDAIKRISQKYKVEVMLDNCENHLGVFKNKNINSFFTSTTSTYFGHLIQSVEGGFVFTNSKKEYEYFVMARNHGMTRSLKNPEPYLNPLVDPRFDFHMKGSNFRNSNINALLCSLNFQRVDKYIKARLHKYRIFKEGMANILDFPEESPSKMDVPFCLPIIPKKEYRHKTPLFKQYCETHSIETRPLVSGNLLTHTAFKEYGNWQDFKHSTFLQDHCFYIGLYPSLKDSNIRKLCKEFNKI